MNFAQLQDSAPILLSAEASYQDTRASLQTVSLWSDDERAAWGIYTIQDDPIPEGKQAVSSTLVKDENIIRRVWALEDVPPPPVPQSITPAQARAQLCEMGLLDEAEALVAAHPYPLVRIYWNSALQFDRDNAYIAALAYELGVDENLDDLFRAAGARVF